MRKSVPKLSRELPEGPSDLESLSPQTIHLPPIGPPFLISAPFSSLRGGYYNFCIIRLEAHGLRGAPSRQMVSLKMRRRRGKCQREVDFNLCSWRRCLPPAFTWKKWSVVYECRMLVCAGVTAALMGGYICRTGEEWKSSVLSFSDLWWLKTTIRAVSQTSWGKENTRE